MPRSSSMLLRLAICILITLHIVHVDSTDLSVAFATNSKQVETAAVAPSNYKSLARSTVCNMTAAFPALTKLPKPWNCPSAQNITWCDFTGVTCRPAAKVTPYIITELKLTSSSLKGTIPSSLSNLQFALVSMVMDSNSIYGTIPSQLGNLLSLTALYLHKNSLGGTVPLELTKLTNLKMFNVNFNYMNGTLPSWFNRTSNNVTASTPATFVLWTPRPTGQPTVDPTAMPLNSARPTRSPTAAPSIAPTPNPTPSPTIAPSAAPSTLTPSLVPSKAPSAQPSSKPVDTPAAATTALSEGKIAAAVVMSIVGAALLGWFVYKCFIEEDDEEDLPAGAGEGADKKAANKESDHCYRRSLEINARV